MHHLKRFQWTRVLVATWHCLLIGMHCIAGCAQVCNL